VSDGVLTRPGPAFSNSDDWEQWFENWCERCIHDAPVRRNDWGGGCPLILVALCGEETPAEWWETEDGSPDRYRCIRFRSEDDGPGPEPQPVPDPPDQLGLFERPEGRVRMLTQSGLELTRLRPVVTARVARGML
jgi:hypothetical protein